MLGKWILSCGAVMLFAFSALGYFGYLPGQPKPIAMSNLTLIPYTDFGSQSFGARGTLTPDNVGGPLPNSLTLDVGLSDWRVDEQWVLHTAGIRPLDGTAADVDTIIDRTGAGKVVTFENLDPFKWYEFEITFRPRSLVQQEEQIDNVSDPAERKKRRTEMQAKFDKLTEDAMDMLKDANAIRVRPRFNR